MRPGDVPRRILGREATAEALAMMRLKLNLDAPAIQRYAIDTDSAAPWTQ